MNLKIKICGMRNPQNILAIKGLNPDFMGFIFFKKSLRNVVVTSQLMKVVNSLDTIQKVGVFVDEAIQKVEKIKNRLGLQVIQLHGAESPEYCMEVKKMGVQVMKSFPIRTAEDFHRIENYSICCDYMLLDTKSSKKGGSGTKFNWELLKEYKSDIPFFLSGGISQKDVEKIRNISHPQLFGLDLNSRFEIEPGEKDISRLNKFLKQIQQ